LAELKELHAVFTFFYCVVAPGGDGYEIFSGRVKSANAYEASQAIEMMHGDALEVAIKKLQKHVCGNLIII
jgi:hypothetical protein